MESGIEVSESGTSMSGAESVLSSSRAWLGLEDGWGRWVSLSVSLS